jgi:hypothetical protein
VNSLICISLNLIVNNISFKIWSYMNDESSWSNVLLDASLVFCGHKANGYCISLTLLNCLLKSLKDKWYICEEHLDLGPCYSSCMHWSPSVDVLIPLTTHCNCVIVFWQSVLLSAILRWHGSFLVADACPVLALLLVWLDDDEFLLPIVY